MKNIEKAGMVLERDEKFKEKAAFALASIERASEAIFWVDKNARFVEVNEAGCRHLGYDRDELLSLKVFDINPYFPIDKWEDFWEELKETKAITFEVLHRHKSGRLFPAEVRLNYVKIGDQEVNFAFATDISNRKAVENAIADLSHGIYSAVGDEYFISTVKYLSRFLQSDYAYIAEFVGSNQSRARTLALCAEGRIIDNLEVDLEGTPCKTVTGIEICSYPSGVQDLFPEARMMASLGVQAYFGASLYDSKGEQIGILSLMYRRPVEKSELTESVLKIFAARTSAELERRKSEEILIKSEERYRNITDNATFGISVCDESGQCLVANRALADIVGATVEEVLSQNYFALDSWKRSGLLNVAIDALTSQEKKRDIFHVLTSFDKDVWLDCVFVPYVERGKKYMMFLAGDVTASKTAEKELLCTKNELELKVKERTTDLQKANERLKNQIELHKRTERTLAHNEQKFRAVAMSTSDLIWEGDIRENSLEWHGDIDGILGYDDGEFPRTVSGHMENIHPDDRESLHHAVEKAVATGEDFYAEYRIRCRNGDYRFWEERGRAVGFEDGRAVIWVGSVTDVTMKKRMEEEAKLVQSRLIHANKMTSLGTLVSGVAHEINNPNSYIMSNAEMFTQIWEDAAAILKQQCADQPDRMLGGISCQELLQLAPALLNGICDGSVRIKNIVQSLIDFGKPEKSVMKGFVDIESVIMSAKMMLDNQIKKLTGRFHIECEKGMPPVRGSRQQIEQVFINLIMNALQSLPDREAGIRISCGYDRSGERIAVTVKDEGVGIPENIMQNITDPFFTTRSADGGTGLGLSISYAIIKDHQGEILFESGEGEGTTVTVMLPVQKNLK